MSTVDAISSVINCMEETGNARKKAYGLVVDYQKAFDSVDRGLLIIKHREKYRLEIDFMEMSKKILQCKKHHADESIEP